MTDIFTVEIPALINGPRGPTIYQPATIHGSPQPISKYGIRIPYDDRFADCVVKGDDYPFVYAMTSKPPVIVVDDEVKLNDWANLLYKAAAYRIPQDVLLSDRPLTAAVSLWKPIKPSWGGTDRLSVALHAIQIHGDLTKSEALDARIAEIKGWFDQ